MRSVITALSCRRRYAGPDDFSRQYERREVVAEKRVWTRATRELQERGVVRRDYHVRL